MVRTIIYRNVKEMRHQFVSYVNLYIFMLMYTYTNIPNSSPGSDKF